MPLKPFAVLGRDGFLYATVRFRKSTLAFREKGGSKVVIALHRCSSFLLLDQVADQWFGGRFISNSRSRLMESRHHGLSERPPGPGPRSPLEIGTLEWH